MSSLDSPASTPLASDAAARVLKSSLESCSGGVLASQHLRQAIAARYIATSSTDEIPGSNIQPASLDLRLGDVAYRVRCSFLPGSATVEHAMKSHVIDELDLRGLGAVLETNRPYLVPLKERLSLPDFIRAKANPKSSTGRVDVFTRVITDHSDRFDEIAHGYAGPLWVEVVPLSFPIRISEGLALNQLRLATGSPELADAELSELHQRQPLLFARGAPVPVDQLFLANGMYLTLDLRGNASRDVGYRSRDYAPLLDLTLKSPVDPEPYWEKVRSGEQNRVVLTPKRFHLLMSNEAVSVPPSLAAEMAAYDPTSGELRTHYAGFFDPGFGYDPVNAIHGSRAALEVRAHDVPFMIESGQRVCKLTFERMIEPPETLYGEAIGSSYQQQEETLSKHFQAQPRAVS